LYDRDSKLVEQVKNAAAVSPEIVEARDSLRALAK